MQVYISTYNIPKLYLLQILRKSQKNRFRITRYAENANFDCEGRRDLFLGLKDVEQACLWGSIQ